MLTDQPLESIIVVRGVPVTSPLSIVAILARDLEDVWTSSTTVDHQLATTTLIASVSVGAHRGGDGTRTRDFWLMRPAWYLLHYPAEVPASTAPSSTDRDGKRLYRRRRRVSTRREVYQTLVSRRPAMQLSWCQRPR